MSSLAAMRRGRAVEEVGDPSELCASMVSICIVH